MDEEEGGDGLVVVIPGRQRVAGIEHCMLPSVGRTQICRRLIIYQTEIFLESLLSTSISTSTIQITNNVRRSISQDITWSPSRLPEEGKYQLFSILLSTITDNKKTNLQQEGHSID